MIDTRPLATIVLSRMNLNCSRTTCLDSNRSLTVSLQLQDVAQVGRLDELDLHPEFQGRTYVALAIDGSMNTRRHISCNRS